MSISRQNLTVIIVTFRSENVIHNCIQSIDSDIKILVVDNSNSKEFKENIENKYQNVTCILSEKNSGMGAGNNLGIKNIKTDFAFILNPDVILEPNSIDNLIKESEKLESFGIISPIEVTPSFYKIDWPVMILVSLLLYIFLVFDKKLVAYDPQVMCVPISSGAPCIGIAFSLAILVDFWLGQQSQKLKQKNYGKTPEAYPLRSFVPYGPRIRKCIGVKCPRELKSAAFHFNTKASPRQCLEFCMPNFLNYKQHPI